MARVALVDVEGDVQAAFNRALTLVGETGLSNAEESVVIKVGVFNHKGRVNYSGVRVIDAIVNAFREAPRIYLVESDNYRGAGTERLQVYEELFDRVVPFNLSEDGDTRDVEIAGENVSLSHLLFKPNLFVSTHALRRFVKGTIIKNLLGLIPDRKKARFHKKLEGALLDILEVIGGMDLAVLDATRTYSGPSAARSRDTNVLVVGKDAVAVEAVGATLVGLKPNRMPIIREAMERGLGEGDIGNIEILGSSIESLEGRFRNL